MKRSPLQKELEKIRLTARERDALRARVTSFMKYHPRINSASAPAQKAGVSMVFARMTRLSHTRTRAAVGALVLFAVVTVPALAEYTVPGDTLYPVKVRFNEEVLSTLSFSSNQKIAWETRRVERRLAEARLLASEGRLTDETEAALGETVRSHTQSVQREIAELRTSDAEGAEIAQITFESALDVQSAMLASSVDSPSTGPKSDAKIQTIADTVQQVRLDATREASSSSTLSFDRLITQVEAEQLRVQEALDSVTDAISPADQEKIKVKIAQIAEAVSAAQTLREENEEAAKRALRETLSHTQKLVSFIDDLDVRGAVALEVLIPEVVSEEQQKATIAEDLDTVSATLAQVRASEDFNRTEVRETVEEIEKLLEGAGVMLLQNEIESARIIVVDIDTQVAKLETLLQAPAGDADEVTSEEGTAPATNSPEVVDEEKSNPPAI